MSATPEPTARADHLNSKTMLSTAAYLSDAQISYGVDTDIPQAMQSMDPWTVTLTTEHGSESFPYFMGRGHNGAEPKVADLIYSLVSDASYLECEPDQVTYETGKAIEANNAKLAHLFGSYWGTLQQMDEDQIREIF